MAIVSLLSQIASSACVNVSAVDGGGGSQCTGLPTVNAGPTQLGQITGVVFGIVAAISVLMIVISGVKFVTSNGNPESVSKARNTMIYAVVGLVVALSAEAIVAFGLKYIP